jgi:hypothetical protein
MSVTSISLLKRDEFILYHYVPNKGVAIEFTVLFIVTLLYLIYSVAVAERRFKREVDSKSRKRFVGIMIPLMIGIIMEVVGYVARIISAGNKEALTPYIIQTLLLLIAPAFIAATVYMCLGEIIKSLGAGQYSLIPLKYLTKLFVMGDVSSFLLQAAGGGIMSSGNTGGIGKTLIIIGLFVQVAFFGGFVVVMSLFSYRIHHTPTKVSSSLKNTRPAFGNWKHGLVVLVISSILILIRSLYRVVEYVQGQDGYLMSHEVYLFIFDSFLIFLCVVVLETNNFTRYFCSVKAEDICNDDMEEMNPFEG